MYGMRCKPLFQSEKGKGCKGRVVAKLCRMWGSQSKWPFRDGNLPSPKAFVKNKTFSYISFQFRLFPSLSFRVVWLQKFRNILLITICLNGWTYWTSTPGPNICGHQAATSVIPGGVAMLQISATSPTKILWIENFLASLGQAWC